MEAAAVKGLAFMIPVKRTKECLEQGKLREEELSNWLTDEDREFLSQPIHSSFWYPIETSDRFFQLLRDVVGGGDDEYFKEFGSKAVEEVLESSAVRAIVVGAPARATSRDRSLPGTRLSLSTT
jgi:hypothetical protein